MTETKVSIEKLVLIIGEKEITLTLDEARGLQEALGDLLGKKEVHHHHTKEIVRENWPYNPWRPYYLGTAVEATDSTSRYKDFFDKYQGNSSNTAVLMLDNNPLNKPML